CGEDTLGVAPRENSSMPGLLLQTKPLSQPETGVWLLIFSSLSAGYDSCFLKDKEKDEDNRLYCKVLYFCRF
ncbi:MAG: hypothetical protein WBG73_09520, partial [Coleofasciculaceae cyanobacterium]